ncbi:AzlC family ABC transporter permease [Clostridiaceae bacterium NSJ-33]|uniref:AzlC family ABC transporter permease n=1 Tax=Fumia xinanensis TaxID=2763659 RepID=A0A926I8C0_9FIRM|nr:AzlC family ABC transporter permease [Fumia xinanensis]MBC8560834.1 AzlC family ABC transporter permease [Fumia xinanensis]
MEEKKKALKAAFPHTIPVLTGFIVLGAAYGILMTEAGYSWVWTVLTCTFVFAGSMQFVSVGMLSLGFHPISAVLMTLMVNARHLFYGISMLQKFNSAGKLKLYLIFSLCDETFSILCTAHPPAGVSYKWFMFFIAVLDHLYWIMGGLLGSVLGSFLTFNTKGIDFVLTALFVVIFINQWKATKNHLPVIVGVGASLICLILFGPSNFLIPAMIVILLLITLLKKPMEKEELL